jgi:hypothetical protein
MAIKLSVKSELIDEALAVSDERTKSAVVTSALKEFIARRKQKHLLDLMGRLKWDDSFDRKGERTRR